LIQDLLLISLKSNQYAEGEKGQTQGRGRMKNKFFGGGIIGKVLLSESI